MFPDSDSIDDILLPPAVSTGRTQGKFQPKLRSKTTKMTLVPSSTSDATHPIRLKDSDLDPRYQEGLNVPPSCIADSCSIALDNHATQEYVNQLKPAESEDFISNVDNEESLQQDQGNSGENADMFFSEDSLDNLLQPASTNGVDESVGPSTLKPGSSPLGVVPSKHHATQEPLHLINEPVVHNETSQCGVQISERDINLQSNLDKSEAEAVADISGMESLDDILFLPDGTSDSADHLEASHCKDLHMDGDKEEVSQHDQERPVEVADMFFGTESLDDGFPHGPATGSL